MSRRTPKAMRLPTTARGCPESACSRRGGLPPFREWKIKPRKKENDIMKKYECDPCGYVYDPAEGDPDNDVAPGTAFEDLPEEWVCPVCGAGKEEFKPVED